VIINRDTTDPTVSASFSDRLRALSTGDLAQNLGLSTRGRSSNIEQNSRIPDTSLRLVQLNGHFANQEADFAKLYPYAPLQDGEIRVLELEPGEWADPLACRIKHVALKDCGRYGEQYEALSYVWGTGHTDFALDVLGSYLMITQSLRTALMYFRSASGSFVSNRLWVDQICINQDNLAERSAQVGIMGRIYQTASSVVIWLGEADNTAIEAFAYIEKHSDFTSSLLFLDVDRRREEIQRDIARSNVVWQLFSYPWFYRAWTFQELVLSQSAEIRCGHRSINWSTIERFVTFLKMHDVQVKSSFGHTEATMAIIENFLSIAEAKLSQKSRSEDDPPRLKFVELLQSRREARSTDPRDRIYSLLGLCDWSVRDDIKPDYTASLVDLQLLVARYLLATHGPQALCLVETPADDAALPTWAPSWAQARGEERHDWVHIWSNPGTQDTANGLTWKDDRTLQLQGTFVGVLTDVRKVPGMKSYRFQNHFGEDIPAGNFSSITKILFGPDLAEETNEEFTEDDLMFEGKWQRARTWGCGIQLDVLNGAASSDKAFSRRFDCLAVSTVQNGDLVYLFRNCYTPFVLRRRGEGFAFVGTSYVHGLYHHELSRRTGSKDYVQGLSKVLGSAKHEEILLE
jgi:hypothetical protein